MSTTEHVTAEPVTAERIAAELARSRALTRSLVDDLTEADQLAQHSPLMSPLVWDLAHVGNYEELWLLRSIDGRPPIDEKLDWMYNAFEHPRWKRPSLPLLGPAEARAYLDTVRGEVLDLLARADFDQSDLLRDGYVYGMVLQHEHQHTETMLATRQLAELSCPPPPSSPKLEDSPALSAGRRTDFGRGSEGAPPGTAKFVPETAPGAGRFSNFAGDGGMVRIDGGRFVMGLDQRGWSYDNERCAHEVELAPYLLDVTPVTNHAYLEFVDDGGYDRAELWHPEGWAWRQTENAAHPQFWERDGTRSWCIRRFGRRIDLTDLLDEPVQHVCWYEADAFARWAGKRLPTEAEWERAATWHDGRKRAYPWGDRPPAAEHALLARRHDGPGAVGRHPSGASPEGVHDLVGDVWEWTSSDFTAYPGFESFPYDEYSKVFFGSEYKVLRGGSWAVDPLAIRGTFRNWDFPIRRQIFAGFRCAKDDN